MLGRIKDIEAMKTVQGEWSNVAGVVVVVDGVEREDLCKADA